MFKKFLLVTAAAMSGVPGSCLEHFLYGPTQIESTQSSQQRSSSSEKTPEEKANYSVCLNIKNINEQIDGYIEGMREKTLPGCKKTSANQKKYVGYAEKYKKQAQNCFTSLLLTFGSGLYTLYSREDFSLLIKSIEKTGGISSSKQLLHSKKFSLIDDECKNALWNLWEEFYSLLEQDIKDNDSITINYAFAKLMCDERLLLIPTIVNLTPSERWQTMLDSKDGFFRKTAEDYIQKQFGITGKQFLTVVKAGEFSTLLDEGPSSPEIQRIIEAAC